MSHLSLERLASASIYDAYDNEYTKEKQLLWFALYPDGTRRKQLRLTQFKHHVYFELLDLEEPNMKKVLNPSQADIDAAFAWLEEP